MRDGPSPALGRAALERASRSGERRAVSVLRRSVLDVRARGGWDASDGRVEGIDVTLLTDGHALGLLATSPFVLDATTEAIASAAPDTLRASVLDVRAKWALREGATDIDGSYRGEVAIARVDVEDSQHLREALAAFVRSAGMGDALADAIDDTALVIGAHEVGLIGLSANDRGTRSQIETKLGDALTRLLGRPIRARARA